jgi:hypothetical protein
VSVRWLLCWCVEVLMYLIVLMCWWPWCVAIVLTIDWCVDVLVCRWVDELKCWWLCWCCCVDDCVDVLMSWWIIDVLMCWSHCVDVLIDNTWTHSSTRRKKTTMSELLYLLVKRSGTLLNRGSEVKRVFPPL